jgi:hypothetical protein
MATRGTFDRPALGEEYEPPGEQQHIESLIRRLREKMERDYAGGRVLRDAHPKMHGCVRGEFSIEPGLPEDLRVGIFAAPRTYPAWIRFSNQSNTVAPDSNGDIRGAAIKLMEVPGPKLQAASPDEATHDFILISEDRFVTKDVAQFDGLVGALIGGPLHMVWFFLCHPRAARNLWVSLKQCRQPLAIRYFSVAPYAWGSNAVKYCLTPHDADTAAPDTGGPDYLRAAMVERLGRGSAAFDFSVQLQVDPVAMPIEDPGVRWDETVSPFRKVATLTIPSQPFDTPARREFGDNLSFNPWRCLAAHRPLGGISRARRQVYQALSVFRHARNHAPQVEPAVDDKEWDASDPKA